MPQEDVRKPPPSILVNGLREPTAPVVLYEPLSWWQRLMQWLS